MPPRSKSRQVRRTPVKVGKMVRRFRRLRQMTLRGLAAKCGFSPSFISQVELGQASPSIASTERIASALGVTLGDFFSVGTSSSPPGVIKAKDRLVLESAWSRAKIESLGLPTEHSALEAMLVTLRPGGASASRPHARDMEQLTVVFRGTMHLQMGEIKHVLREGDAITLPPEVPHVWKNTSRKPVQILIVTVRHGK